MAIAHNENLCVCVGGAWKVLGFNVSTWMLLNITACLHIGMWVCVSPSHMCVHLFINLQYLVDICERSWMFPCWRSLFCFVYLHAAKWLLAVLVTTSGWHSEPVNQAAGKLGGSAPNRLLEIIPKLSMNYPPELRHSKSGLVH